MQQIVNVCVCVFVWACVYVYVYIYIYIYMCLCVCAHVHIHSCIHTLEETHPYIAYIHEPAREFPKRACARSWEKPTLSHTRSWKSAVDMNIFPDGSNCGKTTSMTSVGAPLHELELQSPTILGWADRQMRTFSWQMYSCTPDRSAQFFDDERTLEHAISARVAVFLCVRNPAQQHRSMCQVPCQHENNDSASRHVLRLQELMQVSTEDIDLVHPGV